MHPRSLISALCFAASVTSFHADPDGQKIHLTTYCPSNSGSNATPCMRDWIAEGYRNPQKTLYADAGTYLYHDAMLAYDKMKLECAGVAQTTFKNMGDEDDPRSSGVFLTADSHVNELRVENCAFDVNGNRTKFLAVIDISPEDDPEPSRKIVVARNRIYDGAKPGIMSDSQRQYILLQNCHDCLVEGNHLSEGGRIRVGEPGERLRILGDTVDDANDNAITVSDDHNAVSQDIEIRGNIVRRPKEIGIYFGIDGDKLVFPGMTGDNIRVEENRIEGDWGTACVFGRLPNHSRTIRVLRNTCVKTGPNRQYAAGIRIRRPDDAVLPSSDIKIEHNTLLGTSATLPALDVGIYFSQMHDKVTVSRNEITNIGTRAMLFDGVLTHAKIVENTIGTAEIQVSGTIQGQVQQPYSLAPTGSVTP